MKAPHMHPFVQLIKEDIPMVFRIFARDIRNLWRRPVALIIVLGVAFIPSLYAWTIFMLTGIPTAIPETCG